MEPTTAELFMGIQIKDPVLSANIRLGRKWLAVINTLDYFGNYGN